MEDNFLQWFNLRGGGTIPVLFIMGVFTHLLKINYLGVIFIVVAGVLAVIYAIIDLDEKAKKSKRGY